MDLSIAKYGWKFKTKPDLGLSITIDDYLKQRFIKKQMKKLAGQQVEQVSSNLNMKKILTINLDNSSGTKII